MPPRAEDEATFVEVTDPDEPPAGLEAQPLHLIGDVMTAVVSLGDAAVDLVMLAGANEEDVDAAHRQGFPDIPEGMTEEAYYEQFTGTERAREKLALVIAQRREVLAASARMAIRLDVDEERIESVLEAAMGKEPACKP